MQEKKYNIKLPGSFYCIATFIAALLLGGPGGPAWPAPIGSKDLKPLLEFEDANRVLLRKKDPAAMEQLAQQSASRWTRTRAAGALAGHYAYSGLWSEYDVHARHASDCARALAALARSRRAAAIALADPVLRVRKSGSTCKKAQDSLALSGLVRDRQVWRSIRFLVDKRRSQDATKLLRLLRESRVSSQRFRTAIQTATRRMALRAELIDRTEQELMAVSAVVAAHSKPLYAGNNWGRHVTFIDEDLKAEVWAKIGKWTMLDHHFGDAITYYGRAPLEAHGEQELEWRVRTALRNGDWEDVARTIEFMSAEQASLSAWRYWEAYAYSKLGRAPQMRTVMRAIANEYDDYYGLLAKAHAGIELSLTRREPEPELLARLGADPDVRMAIALGLSGRTATARNIWKYLRRELDSSELLAIAAIAAANGWLLGSVNAADTVPPELSDHQLRFPVIHQDSVNKYSDDFGLNPAMIYAIMRQESRFNPKAVSSSGARGLMQVMPKTASAVARRYKYTRYNKSRLFLPNTNLIIASSYLADLEEMMDEDPVYVSASYNAGENAVKRWRRQAGDIDKTVFIETIPYTETRLYVKYILANLQHYDLLLNDGKVKVAELVKLQPI